MQSAGEIPHSITGGAVSLPERPEAELDLLIREARRRQRRRHLTIAVVVVSILCGAAVARVAVLPGLWAAAQPFSHFPSLGPDGKCPVEAGSRFNGADFSGPALGRGPVRVLIGNGGDPLAGRIELGLASLPRWRAIETIWFATPGYHGPFKVSGIRLGHPGAIAVQPAGDGNVPGSGPLVVPAGPTMNTFPDGYRMVPGSTWVRSPGCYAYRVSGRGFSENIVFDAVARTS
jgi:hypothetical protein